MSELSITAFARKGGEARAKKLSKKRRMEISMKANEVLAKKRAAAKRAK
jgi:hypothetical protein